MLASESHGWSPFRPKAKSRPKAMSMRLGALFVAVCMTVIAASAGAVVFFGYGFTGADAIVVAIAALTALALYNAVSTRMNIRAVIGPQLTELSRGTADLARQLAEMGRRLAVLESRLERTLAPQFEAIRTVSTEYTARLTPEEAADLVLMTPSARHVTSADLAGDAAGALPTEVDISVLTTAYRPR